MKDDIKVITDGKSFKTKQQLEKELQKVENDVLEAHLKIFIPSWRMLDAKIKIWEFIRGNHITKKPSELSYDQLTEVTGVSRAGFAKWFNKLGFEEFLDDSANFQDYIDKGALRMLKRLEELAFTEGGNAGVAACKAYLTLTSFAKQRVEMSIDDVARMSDADLEREIADLEKKLKG